MRLRFAFPVALLLNFTASYAFADIASIHSGALPQEPAVLAALDDAAKLEPYASAWTDKWNYPIAKNEVADRLEKDIGFLTAALHKHPDNVDLALLTGLVFHYAYNLDVPNSYDKAISAFEQARKSAPGDLRTEWFQADLLCQTSATKTGAQGFLAIESAHPWNELPAAFWGDYMSCATITNMPAHVLRAASYLDKLHAAPSQMHTFLADIARKRFDAFDPKKKYEPKEVWYSSNTDKDPNFTSTVCGIGLIARANWTIEQLTLGNGVCVAYFSTGPYQGTVHSLHPSVMVLARQPRSGETLDDFVKTLTHGDTTESFTPIRCPSSTCLAQKGVQPNMYKQDGDGKGRTVAFERPEPEFPGLIFESPSEAPKSDPEKGPQYFRPSQTLQRIPGKLYYLVLLDTAASIETPALSDFDFFLQNLVIE
jgi:hypothetical protein